MEVTVIEVTAASAVGHRVLITGIVAIVDGWLGVQTSLGFFRCHDIPDVPNPEQHYREVWCGTGLGMSVTTNSTWCGRFRWKWYRLGDPQDHIITTDSCPQHLRCEIEDGLATKLDLIRPYLDGEALARSGANDNSATTPVKLEATVLDGAAEVGETFSD